MSDTTEGESTESGFNKRWKTVNEREVLECYFELDPDWTRKTIIYIKDLVLLSEKQIYKWGYEKRRRLNLDQKDAKQVNPKYMTHMSDLDAPIDKDNFNQIVSDLFPEEENEEEVLTDEQKEIYDYVKKQLIQRNMKYEQQSDLDKLLNDRIPIKNIAIEAKATQDTPIITPKEEIKTVSDSLSNETDIVIAGMNNIQKIKNSETKNKYSDSNSAEKNCVSAAITSIFDLPDDLYSPHFGSEAEDDIKDSQEIKPKKDHG